MTRVVYKAGDRVEFGGLPGTLVERYRDEDTGELVLCYDHEGEEGWPLWTIQLGGMRKKRCCERVIKRVGE